MWHDVLLAQAVVESTDRVLLSGHIVWIVGLAATGLIAAATWATAMLAKKLAVQQEGTLKAMLLQQLSEFTEAVVAKLGATFKREYALAASDGRITETEAKALVDAALADLKTLLGEEGLVRLQKTFGWGPAQSDMHLKGVVQQKIVQQAALTGTLVPLRP